MNEKEETTKSFKPEEFSITFQYKGNSYQAKVETSRILAFAEPKVLYFVWPKPAIQEGETSINLFNISKEQGHWLICSSQGALAELSKIIAEAIGKKELQPQK